MVFFRHLTTVVNFSIGDGGSSIKVLYHLIIVVLKVEALTTAMLQVLKNQLLLVHFRMCRVGDYAHVNFPFSLILHATVVVGVARSEVVETHAYR